MYGQLPDPPSKVRHRINFLFNGRPRVITQLTASSVEVEEVSDEEEYFAKRCRRSGDVLDMSMKEKMQRDHEAGDFDLEDSPADEEFEFDEHDLITQVDQFVSDTSNVNLDEEELPEETGTRTKDPKYVFCPPEHRLPILRLFAKHHALHPLLSERHGQQRTPDEIYRDAVTEMYTHCKRNNLREVWAYMWNSWYVPAKW